MRKSKLAVAIAAAGVVAAGASAFTASSTIDNSTKHVGAIGQTISGVHVSNVAYTWDSSTDTTSGVSFHTAETLGSNDNLTVSLTDGTTSVSSDGTVKVTPADGSTIQTTVVLRTLLGSINCVYRAPSLTGKASNDDNSITFTAQQFTKFSGSSLCFANGFFTAKYAPVRDISQNGSPLVYVN